MADQPVPQAPSITVASAPPAKAELTPEQRRQRYADLRARAGRSMIDVDAPAGKSGYWARKDDAAELSRLFYQGFSIVHDDPKKPVWKANGAQQDGTYVIGDVILLEIDAELYEALKDANSMDMERMMNGAAEGFKNQAAMQGVPTFEVSKPTRGR